MRVVSPVCAGLLISRRCIRYVPVHMDLPIYRLCAWPPRCIFDLWVPNFGVQEYMGYSEQMLEVFPHNWTFDNGYMHPETNPALGSSLTKNWRRNIRMTLHICLLLARKMARCGTGKYKFYVRKMLINPIPYRRLNLWLVQSILKTT